MGSLLIQCLGQGLLYLFVGFVILISGVSVQATLKKLVQHRLLHSYVAVIILLIYIVILIGLAGFIFLPH